MTNHLFDRVNIYGDLASNHGGHPKVYDQLVKGIQEAGAIPKIQLFSPKTFDRDWDLPEVWVPSVFCPSDVEFAMANKPLALKIASVEATHYDLIRVCMDTGLPLMISTGGMTVEELIELCELLDPYSGNVCLMHCVSMYPTPFGQANMTRISQLADLMEDMLLKPIVGWSSHHLERITTKLLRIALAYDANQIEVHVKIDAVDESTPDKTSALNLGALSHLIQIIQWTDPVFGDAYDEDYIPPDRAAVLEWRKRWQTQA
jgi:sialic acid synthase SpsE